jgi:FAD/FMN-containing dehydrogenase
MKLAYTSFLRALNISGDIHSDIATRISLSTDNSIYEVLPTAVIFPKTHDDIAAIFALASQPQFQTLQFFPRGGGTGTNGQSLGAGITLDCSKHMRDIIDINVKDKTVRVMPGVILDELGLALEPYGLFFAPSLSPSNRATLGGMFNTDACGLGSTHYGRTSDHVLNAKLVLPNGETLNTADEHSGAALRSTLTPLLQQHKAEIQKQSPDLPRGLTGYNLAKSVGKNCNLTYLLSGSEGTLGVVTELTLKLTPLPETKALLACFYPDFQSALEHGRELLALKPTAIETVDDNILTLAQDDEIYTHIEHLLPTNKTLGGLNLIEFVGAKAEVAQNIKLSV